MLVVTFLQCMLICFSKQFNQAATVFMYEMSRKRELITTRFARNDIIDGYKVIFVFK